MIFWNQYSLYVITDSLLVIPQSLVNQNAVKFRHLLSPCPISHILHFLHIPYYISPQLTSTPSPLLPSSPSPLTFPSPIPSSLPYPSLSTLPNSSPLPTPLFTDQGSTLWTCTRPMCLLCCKYSRSSRPGTRSNRPFRIRTWLLRIHSPCSCEERAIQCRIWYETRGARGRSRDIGILYWIMWNNYFFLI